MTAVAGTKQKGHRFQCPSADRDNPNPFLVAHGQSVRTEEIMRSRFHHVNVAVAELEKHGAVNIEVEPRNGHPAVWFSWNGERRFIRVAGSPSSQNSWRKVPTKVRRALGVGPYSRPTTPGQSR